MSGGEDGTAESVLSVEGTTARELLEGRALFTPKPARKPRRQAAAAHQRGRVEEPRVLVRGVSC